MEVTEDCPDCEYARQERAGICMSSGTSLADADALAAGEKCPAHRAQEVTGEGLKITVKAWEKGAQQPGEFIGWPRTLAGPYRFGFDGSHEEVLEKYRRWLFAEIRAKGKAWRKMVELLDRARGNHGLVLVCMEVEIGGVIERALRWMEKERGHG